MARERRSECGGRHQLGASVVERDVLGVPTRIGRVGLPGDPHAERPRQRAAARSPRPASGPGRPGWMAAGETPFRAMPWNQPLSRYSRASFSSWCGVITIPVVKTRPPRTWAGESISSDAAAL